MQRSVEQNANQRPSYSGRMGSSKDIFKASGFSRMTEATCLSDVISRRVST